MSVKIEDKDKVHRGNAEVWKWIKRTESEASLTVNLGKTISFNKSKL